MSAEISAQISQIEKYKSAVQTFRSKYNAIPGDMVNATQFGLGSASGPGANGNGNGFIAPYYSSNPSQDAESMNFWYHLNQAGLIPFSAPGYTSGYAFSTQASMLAVSPSSPINPSAMVIATSFVADLEAVWCSDVCVARSVTAGNGFMIVTADYSSGQWTRTALSSIAAGRIDMKMDDGVLFAGNISCGGHDRNWAAFFGAGSATCGYSACQSSFGSNQYGTSTTPNCNLAFARQF